MARAAHAPKAHLRDQDVIESWKQGTEYRRWQRRADQELAFEAAMNWDPRYSWAYQTVLSEEPEIRDIQIANIQKSERRDELYSEIYRQWRWAWSAPRPKP